MKEFIDKLIGRLEEEKAMHTKFYRLSEYREFPEVKTRYELIMHNLNKTIEIVNELAEEYINTSTDTSTDTSSGWIPCSERLPKIGEQVMVCNIYGSVFVSNITHLKPRVDSRGMCHDFGKHYGVIAWQPLPAPYKEGCE